MRRFLPGRCWLHANGQPASRRGICARTGQDCPSGFRSDMTALAACGRALRELAQEIEHIGWSVALSCLPLGVASAGEWRKTLRDPRKRRAHHVLRLANE